MLVLESESNVVSRALDLECSLASLVVMELTLDLIIDCERSGRTSATTQHAIFVSRELKTLVM